MKVLNNRAYHNLVIFDARRGTLTREFTNTLEYKVSYLSESYVCFSSVIPPLISPGVNGCACKT